MSESVSDDQAEEIRETEASHEAVKRHPEDLVDYVVFGLRMPDGRRVAAVSRGIDILFKTVPDNPEPRLKQIVERATLAPESSWGPLGIPEYESVVTIGAASHAVRIAPFQSAVRPAVFHYRVDIA